eukprot:m.62171 g.62171  ORF g.62171 m.62171 type:complete len:56 (+) comp23101_c0_seq2:900-1067(+)
MLFKVLDAFPMATVPGILMVVVDADLSVALGAVANVGLTMKFSPTSSASYDTKSV